MPDAGSERFSAEQRLYVQARLAADRWTVELEAGRRRIEADPDRSEADKTAALSKLSEAAREHDAALAQIEEAILSGGETLPTGELFDRVAAVVEAEEAEGVDVPAQTSDQLRERRGEAGKKLAEAEERLREIEAAGIVGACVRCLEPDCGTAFALAFYELDWLRTTLLELVDVPRVRATSMLKPLREELRAISDGSLDPEEGSLPTAKFGEESSRVLLPLFLCRVCAQERGLSVGEPPELPCYVQEEWGSREVRRPSG